MSFVATGLVWKFSRSKGTDRLVLLALADRAGDDLVCWPGKKDIATRCRMSARTVQRSIKALQELEEIKVDQRAGKKANGGQTNRYRITITPETTCLPETNGAHLEDTGVSAPGDRRVSNPETTVSLKPSVNHQKESSHTLRGFEQFFSAYPKQEDKKTAEQAWSKIPEREKLLPTMLEALGWQVKQDRWKDSGGRYIPAPASWLKKRRWEDKPPNGIKTDRPRQQGPQGDVLPLFVSQRFEELKAGLHASEGESPLGEKLRSFIGEYADVFTRAAPATIAMVKAELSPWARAAVDEVLSASRREAGR